MIHPLRSFNRKFFNAVYQCLQHCFASAADAAARAVIMGRGIHHYRHLDHFEPALFWAMENLMPKKILLYVKRNLRRNTRKPKDMKVRIFFQHLTRINTEEVPSLPPLATTNAWVPMRSSKSCCTGLLSRGRRRWIDRDLMP